MGTLTWWNPDAPGGDQFGVDDGTGRGLAAIYPVNDGDHVTVLSPDGAVVWAGTIAYDRAGTPAPGTTLAQWQAWAAGHNRAILAIAERGQRIGAGQHPDWGLRPRQYRRWSDEEAAAWREAELARGAAVVRRLLAGPEMLDAAALGDRLGMAADRVDWLRRSDRLLALAGEGTDWRYPAWQVRDGAILPGLDRILVVARHGPWQVYRVLLMGHPETDGRTGLQALLDGDVEAVLAAIRALNASAGGAD